MVTFWILVCYFFNPKWNRSRCRSRWENLDRGQYRFQPIKFVNSVVPSPCETQPYNKDLYYITSLARSGTRFFIRVNAPTCWLSLILSWLMFSEKCSWSSILISRNFNLLDCPTVSFPQWISIEVPLSFPLIFSNKTWLYGTLRLSTTTATLAVRD